MHAMYALVAGPLAWTALVLFFGGLVFRVIQLLRQIHKSEPFIYSYMSWRYAWRSILHWLIPYGTASWRLHPLVTLVTFVFHICLLAAPILLSAHMVLVNEAWGLDWITLPDGVADIMTVLVVAGCIFFLFRRIIRPEVRFVTNVWDVVLLVVVAAPFISGFIAYHQWGGVNGPTIAHMLTGEILLVAIPFTRLSHMILSIFTRGYMGSEFGKVRHARDW